MKKNKGFTLVEVVIVVVLVGLVVSMVVPPFLKGRSVGILGNSSNYEAYRNEIGLEEFRHGPVPKIKARAAQNKVPEIKDILFNERTFRILIEGKLYKLQLVEVQR